MIKIVTFFLIGMVVLALFGRLRLPGLPTRKAAKCPHCGAYLVGRGPCHCKKVKGS